MNMLDQTPTDSLIISIAYDTLIVNGQGNHYLLKLLKLLASTEIPFSFHITSLAQTELPLSAKSVFDQSNLVPIISIYDQAKDNNNSFNNMSFLSNENKTINLLNEIQQNNPTAKIVHLDCLSEIQETGQLSAHENIQLLRFNSKGNPWSDIYNFLLSVGFVNLLDQTMKDLKNDDLKEIGQNSPEENINLYIWISLFVEKDFQKKLWTIIKANEIVNNPRIVNKLNLLFNTVPLNQEAISNLYRFEFEKIVLFQEKHDKTPLQYIIENQNNHTVDDFLNGNFESREMVNSRGENALHTAMMFSIDKAVVKRLLQAGYDPADQDKKGNNALHHGVKRLQESLGGHLPLPSEDEDKIKFKSAFLQPNQENQMPLHLAISMGNLIGFYELINLGSKVKIDLARLRGPDKENLIFSILKRLDTAPKNSKPDPNIGKMLIAVMKITPPTLWDEWLTESYKGKSFLQYATTCSLSKEMILSLTNPVLYKWAEMVCLPSLTMLTQKTEHLKGLFETNHNKLLRNQVTGMAAVIISVDVEDLENKIKKANADFQKSEFYTQWSSESKKFITLYYPDYLYYFFTIIFDSYEKMANQVLIRLGNICLSAANQAKTKPQNNSLESLIDYFNNGKILEFNQALLELEQTKQIDLKEIDFSAAEEKNIAIILANRTSFMSPGSDLRHKAVTMLAILATKNPELFYAKNSLNQSPLSILANVGIPFELMMIGISHCVQVSESILAKSEALLSDISNLSKSDSQQLTAYLSKSRVSGIPDTSKNVGSFSQDEEEKAAYKRFFDKLNNTIQNTKWESFNSRYSIEIKGVVTKVPLTIKDIDMVLKSLMNKPDLNDYQHAFSSLKLVLKESSEFRLMSLFFRKSSTKVFYKNLSNMCQEVKGNISGSLNMQTDQFETMMQSVTKLIK